MRPYFESGAHPGEQDNGLKIVGYGPGGRPKYAPQGADGGWEDGPSNTPPDSANSSENGM